MSNMENEILKRMSQVLNSLNYTEKVYAEIDGDAVYLNEAEVRALQYICKKIASNSESAFSEFCTRVIVYSGPDKNNSEPMEFCKDGRFLNEFKDGFFDVCSKLTWARL